MRRGARALAATLTAVALALGAAGCGDEASDDTTEEPTADSDLADLRLLPTTRVGSLLPEDLSGWLLADVHSYGSRLGEYEVHNTELGHDPDVTSPAEVTVTWRDPADYEDYLADRRDVSDPEEVQVGDGTGELFTYSDHDFTVLLHAEAPASFIELRGTYVTREDFEAFLAGMHPGTEADFDRLLRDSGLSLDKDGSA